MYPQENLYRGIFFIFMQLLGWICATASYASRPQPARASVSTHEVLVIPRSSTFVKKKVNTDLLKTSFKIYQKAPNSEFFLWFGKTIKIFWLRPRLLFLC